jgi:hypothetical protein
MTERPVARRRRRPHPAHRARVASASLGFATLAGLVATMGFNQPRTAALPELSSPPAVTAPVAVTSPAGGTPTGERPTVHSTTTTTAPPARTHGSR